MQCGRRRQSLDPSVGLRGAIVIALAATAFRVGDLGRALLSCDCVGSLLVKNKFECCAWPMVPCKSVYRSHCLFGY